MKPQEEQFNNALEGKAYQCIFFPNIRMKIISVQPEEVVVEMVVKEATENPSGLGKTQITKYMRWLEVEKIRRLKHGFNQAEYNLMSKEDNKKFLKLW